MFAEFIIFMLLYIRHPATDVEQDRNPSVHLQPSVDIDDFPCDETG